MRSFNWRFCVVAVYTGYSGYKNGVCNLNNPGSNIGDWDKSTATCGSSRDYSYHIVIIYPVLCISAQSILLTKG